MRQRRAARVLICVAAALAACARSDSERVAAAASHLESFSREARYLDDLERRRAAAPAFLALHRHMLAQRVQEAAASLSNASRVEGPDADRRRAALERARQLELELAR